MIDRMPQALPTLDRERTLLAERPFVIALDEVGRGALAGPVAVGAVAVDLPCLGAAGSGSMPAGLRDSKLVPEPRRRALARAAAAWVPASAVGWASAAEVDDLGILPALGLASARALADLAAHGVALAEAAVLLDGNFDYVSRYGTPGLAVTTQVKGDRDCGSVAAASVIAKFARDALMALLHDELPVYGWDRNKGYGSASHRAALAEHGVSPHHRASWRLGPDAPEALF